MKTLAVSLDDFEKNQSSLWKFDPKSKIPVTPHDFVMFQMKLVTQFEYPILRIGGLIFYDQMRFKVLTDCHGDSRNYSVHEWLINEDGVYERKIEFSHTDNDSNMEGEDYFQAIDLSSTILFKNLA